MQLCGLQLDIAWENKSANFARVAELVESTLPPPGSLLVLPEMFATGFSMNVAQIAEPPRGPTAMFLASLASKYEIFVCGGVATRGGATRGVAPDKGRNECLVFAPDGREIARFCKTHPFSFGGEIDHYEAGDDIVLFEWNGFKVAPFICYDLRFPELFRAAVKRGAEVLMVIANWPAAREAHWLALLQARAIENQAYVAGVNRCGADPKLSYSGRSRIIDPRGAIIADAGEAETMIGAELNAAALRTYREEFPALRDMRDF